MIDQQELHHPGLRFFGLLGGGENLHALRHRRRTSRQRLGRLLNLYQAHAAIGGDREFLVVTEVRYIGAELVGGIHHHAAFQHLDLVAVDFEFNHVVSLRLFSHVGRNKATFVLYVMRELVAIILDECAHRHRRGVAERANRAPLDVVGH